MSKIVGIDLGTTNSLVAIDPSDGSVKRVVPVQLGGYPVSVCYGEGAVWTYNSDEQTLIQIDPDHGPVRVRGIGVAPTDVVAGNGYVWVASPETAQVLQLDPVQSTPELIDLGLPPAGQYGAYALALTPGRLWIAAGLNNSVLSVNTATGEVEHNREASLEFQSFYEISASSTQVWAAENVEAASAVKLAPSTGKPLDPPVVLPARTTTSLRPTKPSGTHTSRTTRCTGSIRRRLPASSTRSESATGRPGSPWTDGVDRGSPTASPARCL